MITLMKLHLPEFFGVVLNGVIGSQQVPQTSAFFKSYNHQLKVLLKEELINKFMQVCTYYPYTNLKKVLESTNWLQFIQMFSST